MDQKGEVPKWPEALRYTPVDDAPYQEGPAARQFAATEIQRMLQEKFIESPEPEKASPIVCTFRKDGSLIFCVDYRKRSVVTVRESCLLTRMDEWMKRFGEARFFSTMEANLGYWQVESDERDRSKTAFMSHHELLQLLQMTFVM